MQIALLVIQMLSALVLIVLIMLQSQGSGIGRTWGGGGKSSFTRRGLEKVVFRATFVVAFIFIAVSILQLSV